MEQLTALASLIERYSSGDGIHDTPVRELHFLKFSEMSAPMPTVYQPAVCVVVQGAKQVMLEGEIYRYAPSQFLGISVDLPLVGQVTEAPYLCLQLDLDPRQLAELMTQLGGMSAGETERGVFVGRLDTALADSIVRLARLVETPQDIPLLAPLAVREVYYRLLTGAQGRRVAQIGVTDSSLHRIARVLHTLKSDFTRAMRIEELADMASMSLSSFHHHFKQVTAMSPLQYQKRLRLLEARRIMLAEEAEASAAAYRVGYESPSQFSREYSRMFGAPPTRDVAMLRQAAASQS